MDNIVGTKIEIIVELNIKDDTSYLSITDELDCKIIDTIEELGHNFLMLNSKKITKEEMEGE